MTDEGGFSRAEKTRDHRDRNFVHGSLPQDSLVDHRSLYRSIGAIRFDPRGILHDRRVDRTTGTAPAPFTDRSTTVETREFQGEFSGVSVWECGMFQRL